MNVTELPEETEETIEPRRTSRAVRALRWSLLVFFLAGIALYVSRHSQDFLVIKSLKPLTLAYVIILQILSLCVFATQFFLVAKAFKINVPYLHWLRMVVSSRFLNRIVPQSGNVFRVAELKLAYGVSVKQYIASLATFGAVSRLLGLSIVFVLLSLYRPELEVANLNARWSVFAVLLAAIVATCVLRRLPDLPQDMKFFGSKLLRKLIRLTRKVADLVSDFKLLASLFCLECLIITLSIGCHLLVFHALNVNLHFSEAALLIIIKRIINVATLTPGNVGLIETLYGVVLGNMKDAGAAGILTGAIINLTTFIASGLATLIFSGAFAILGRRNEPR